MPAETGIQEPVDSTDSGLTGHRPSSVLRIIYLQPACPHWTTLRSHPTLRGNVHDAKV